MIAPEPEAVVSGVVDLQVAPTVGMDVYGVSFDMVGSGCSWWVGQPGADGVFAVSADVTVCSMGAQYLTATVYWHDEFGSSHGYQISSPVTVSDVTAPVVSIWSGYGNRVVTLSAADTISEGLVYFRCVDGSPVTWSWELRDADGVVVRTYAEGDHDTYQRGVCENHYYYYSYDAHVSLDGMDDAGNRLADGSYSLTATRTR